MKRYITMREGWSGGRLFKTQLQLSPVAFAGRDISLSLFLSLSLVPPDIESDTWSVKCIK